MTAHAQSSESGTLVSLVLRVYNQAPYVQEALKSVLAQTYEPLEVVIADDASSDGGFEIAQQLALAYRGPHRLILHRNSENQGVGWLSQNAARLCRGAFIVIADGDDIAYPDRVRLLVQNWEASDRRTWVIGSHFDNMDRNGAPLAAEPAIRLDATHIFKGRQVVQGGTAGYDRRIFDLFPALINSQIHEDRVLQFRALLLGGEMAVLPDKTLVYRRHVGLTQGYGQKFKPPIFYQKMIADQLQKMQDAFSVQRLDLLLAQIRQLQWAAFELQLMRQSGFNLHQFVRMVRSVGWLRTCKAHLKKIIWGHESR
jgi:glycosyltransferase involved in cell wall biosynthesis